MHSALTAPFVIILSATCVLACSEDVGGFDAGTGGFSFDGTSAGGSVGGTSAGGAPSDGLSSGGTSSGGTSSGGAQATTGGTSSTGGTTFGTGGSPSSGGGFGVPGSGGSMPAGGGGPGGASSGGTAGGNTGGSSMGTGGSGAGGSSAEFDAEMFFVEACSECHGATGDGVDGKGPDIKHPIEDYSEYVIRNGRGPQDDISGNFNLLYEEAMPAFPEVIISAEELAAVFGFLAMQPQPTEGKMLYEDYCAACHGHDAQGGMTTRSLKSVFGSFSTPIRNGEHTNMMTQRREYMPAFPTDMISDAEIQMIQTYVQGL